VISVTSCIRQALAPDIASQSHFIRTNMWELFFRFFLRCNHNLFISNCCSNGLPQEAVIPSHSLQSPSQESYISSSEDEEDQLRPDDGQT